MGYTASMIEIRKTGHFAKWIDGLQDIRGRALIQARIERLVMGNPKTVGEGASEMRIDHGPGYRVFYIKRERTMIILLAGGDKSTQAKDIKTAIRLARNL